MEPSAAWAMVTCGPDSLVEVGLGAESNSARVGAVPPPGRAMVTVTGEEFDDVKASDQPAVDQNAAAVSPLAPLTVTG